LRIRCDELVRGLRDVPAPAVVSGNSEGQSRIVRGKRFASRDQLADSRLEALRIADHLEADVVLVELNHFLLECPQKELHQDRYLLGRAAPVLARKSKERQKVDAAFDARAHRSADGLDALAVAGYARQHALLRPAAVAIHDDRDV